MILSSARRGSRCAQRRALRVRRAGCRTAIALLIASSAAGSAPAQIAINRTEIVFRTLPNASQVALIDLHNEGGERVQAMVRLEDWDRAQDGTNNWYPYATTPGSCAKALTVFPLSVSLEPGARQSVRVSLDSSTTLDHECWAGAIVETVQPRITGGRSVAYVIRTATKIYVQPATTLPAKGEVVGLRIASLPGDAASTDGVDLLLEFQNTGGRHLITPGEVQFRRPDNSIAATANLPTLYTLPGATSTAKIVVPKLASGRYVILAVLDYGGDELAAGQIEHVVH